MNFQNFCWIIEILPRRVEDFLVLNVTTCKLKYNYFKCILRNIFLNIRNLTIISLYYLLSRLLKHVTKRKLYFLKYKDLKNKLNSVFITVSYISISVFMIVWYIVYRSHGLFLLYNKKYIRFQFMLSFYLSWACLSRLYLVKKKSAIICIKV